MSEKKSNKCSGEIEIYDNGDFKIKRMSKSCPSVLKKINPVRGIFWKNHMETDEKNKLKMDTEGIED